MEIKKISSAAGMADLEKSLNPSSTPNDTDSSSSKKPKNKASSSLNNKNPSSAAHLVKPPQKGKNKDEGARQHDWAPTRA